MLRPINPPGPSIPGISQAMLISEGRLLILSGHVPFDDAGKITGSDLATQLDQVFQNMQATLHAAGADFSALARITIYVRDYDPDQLPTIRTVRDRWIDAKCPPASALIGVAALAFPEMLVEVDAMAFLPA
ncbi:enamine deaminase RidA (YjgF/YER057c/UK114 family) [Rhizobium sp. PP-CC-2G-626]|nr:enamine deaminase RidA (YjgF/YER057c/UK114 family) [Rhizobium sp. PP-CC-2G-626]